MIAEGGITEGANHAGRQRAGACSPSRNALQRGSTQEDFRKLRRPASQASDDGFTGAGGNAASRDWTSNGPGRGIDSHPTGSGGNLLEAAGVPEQGARGRDRCRRNTSVRHRRNSKDLPRRRGDRDNRARRTRRATGARPCWATTPPGARAGMPNRSDRPDNRPRIRRGPRWRAPGGMLPTTTPAGGSARRPFAGVLRWLRDRSWNGRMQATAKAALTWRNRLCAARPAPLDNEALLTESWCRWRGVPCRHWRGR